MTMSRNEKNTHRAVELRATNGMTREKFHSPKMIAETGRATMTITEYREWRMGRGTRTGERLELHRRELGILRRKQRILGGRRITGR